MGLGAYLAALTDIKHYEVKLVHERMQVYKLPDLEDVETYKLLRSINYEGRWWSRWRGS
jgi:hypothetical protein